MSEQNSKCLCETVIMTGLWDGVDGDGCAVGGPTVKCRDCDAEFKLTWEKWNKIPDENKTALA